MLIGLNSAPLKMMMMWGISMKTGIRVAVVSLFAAIVFVALVKLTGVAYGVSAGGPPVANPADVLFYQQQQPPPTGDFLTQATQILFSNGLSGVMIALLTYILFVSNKQAQKERSEHMESVRELWKDNMKTTGNLASEVKEMHGEFKSILSDHSARLQNIEREIDKERTRR